MYISSFLLISLQIPVNQVCIFFSSLLIYKNIQKVTFDTRVHTHFIHRVYTKSHNISILKKIIPNIMLIKNCCCLLLFFITIISAQDIQLHFSPCPSKCRCVKSLGKKYKVYCTNSGLTAVPQPLPIATTYLDLSNNNIQTLSTSDFSGLINLKLVKLDNNQISRVPSYWLHFGPKINTISLRNNRIHTVDRNAFKLPESGLNARQVSNRRRYQRSLRLIDFSNNRLTRIEPRTFSRRIAKIVLSNNELSYLRERNFRGIWKKISIINGNRLVCDCSMKWLIEKKEFPKKLIQATCSSPSPYANEYLYSLRTNKQYADYCGISVLDSDRKLDRLLEYRIKTPEPLIAEEVSIPEIQSPKSSVLGTASPVEQNTLIVGEGDLITLTCGARATDRNGLEITGFIVKINMFGTNLLCFTRFLYQQMSFCSYIL